MLFIRTKTYYSIADELPILNRAPFNVDIYNDLNNDYEDLSILENKITICLNEVDYCIKKYDYPNNGVGRTVEELKVLKSYLNRCLKEVRIVLRSLYEIKQNSN